MLGGCDKRGNQVWNYHIPGPKFECCFSGLVFVYLFVWLYHNYDWYCWVCCLCCLIPICFDCFFLCFQFKTCCYLDCFFVSCELKSCFRWFFQFVFCCYLCSQQQDADIMLFDTFCYFVILVVFSMFQT